MNGENVVYNAVQVPRAARGTTLSRRITEHIPMTIRAEILKIESVQRKAAQVGHVPHYSDNPITNTMGW